MNIVSNKFVTIYEDYMRITDDAGCAAIITLIGNISNKHTKKRDSWVRMKASYIESCLCGLVAKRTIYRKIKLLCELGLIEAEHSGNSSSLYKLNLKEIEQRILDSYKKSPAIPEETIDEEPQSAEFRYAGLAEQDEESQLSSNGVYSQNGNTLRQNGHATASFRTDINNNRKNKKEERVNISCINTLIGRDLLNEKENSIRKREEDLRTTEMLELTETSKSPTLLANREKEENSTPSLKTETIQNEEEEKNMNEDVRTFLKAYDRIPKKLRGKEYTGSITTLYKNFGDALERVIDTYGLDSCLAALEEFKQDSYWLGRGLPLRGIISQIEKYVKIASGETGGYQGVAKEEKVAPRAESAQSLPYHYVVGNPNSDTDPERLIIRAKNRRIMAIHNMMRQVLPELVEQFRNETRDASSVSAERIEEWYKIASEKWRETRKAYEPTGGTKPLC